MDGSYSQFRALLQRRKERSESKNKGNFIRINYKSQSERTKSEFNFSKMTELEFSEFKSKLKAERRNKNLKDLLILGIVFGIIIITLWILN